MVAARIDGRAVATGGWKTPVARNRQIAIAGWLDVDPDLFGPSGSETHFVGISWPFSQQEGDLRCKKRDAELVALLMLMRGD